MWVKFTDPANSDQSVYFDEKRRLVVTFYSGSAVKPVSQITDLSSNNSFLVGEDPDLVIAVLDNL